MSIFMANFAPEMTKKNENKLPASAIEGRHIANYYDDDIIIIDNVKDLVAPKFARVDMNALLVCTAGKAQFDLNGSPMTLARNQLLLTPVNTTLSNFLFSADFEFIILLMTNRILLSFLREKMSIWNEVLYVHKLHVLSLNNKDDLEFFSHFYNLLKLNYETTRHRLFRTEVLQSLLRGGLLGLCGILKEMVDEAAPQPTMRNNHIFQQFIDLLAATPVKHLPVNYYAQRLCVSPKYLSAICKRYSGKSANRWITEQVMEDIRFYITETEKSMKEISNELGFPNPSFFGKYVSIHFGLPPQQLRHHLCKMSP